MNLPLFRRTISASRLEVVATGAGMLIWGTVLPIIYATFGQQIGAFARGNALFEQFSRFGGGDLFSLEGTIALGFVHPFTLLLMGIMAIGFPAVAVAGQRERGTLETLLARPISRRGLYTTLYVAGLIFLAVLLALHLVGSYVGSVVMGVADDLELGRMVVLWFVGWLLFVAFMSLTFAVSVMSDRIGPAIGLPLAFVLANYLANAIGSLWPDMSWLMDVSMFNLVKAQDILAGDVAGSDIAILLAFSLAFVVYALVMFPRRDIPAPA